MMSSSCGGRRAGVRQHRIEPSQPLVVQVGGASQEDRLEQALLVAEVIARERHVDVRGAGDVADRDAVKTTLGEQLLRGVEDALARRLRARAGARAARFGRARARVGLLVVVLFCTASRPGAGARRAPDSAQASVRPATTVEIQRMFN